MKSSSYFLRTSWTATRYYQLDWRWAGFLRQCYKIVPWQQRTGVLGRRRDNVSSSGPIGIRLDICSRLAGLCGARVLGLRWLDVRKKEQAHQDFRNKDIPENQLQILQLNTAHNVLWTLWGLFVLTSMTFCGQCVKAYRVMTVMCACQTMPHKNNFWITGTVTEK